MPLPYRARRTVEYWRNETLLPALIGSQRRRTALEARALRHLHAQIPDPVLRRPTTILTTSPIAELAADAVHTADGRRHEIDELVHATGFHVSAALMRMPVHGRNGISLQEIWARDGASAHLGTTVAGIPNAFVLGGPNAGVGHTSVLFMLESQFRYVAAALDEPTASAPMHSSSANKHNTDSPHASTATRLRRPGPEAAAAVGISTAKESTAPCDPVPHGDIGYTPAHSISTTTHRFGRPPGGSDGVDPVEPGHQRTGTSTATTFDRDDEVRYVSSIRVEHEVVLKHHQCRTITENMPTGRIYSKIT
ncbi:NAD(P)/FAD-dependent oxidoreductase [Rhodococcus rhodochrous]|uniref:hypothetical protein n=1 Tax=Rhodococcus rhodochrous TaxID=1829 RepID=UPI00132E82C5|nr:hypothetical protein [Rhodococcus rhodochrous]QHG83545.1 hypothetical protein D1O33_17480 [Rhodococcus rhodochrous]QOH56777.1 hypothetical protein C6Y44_13010 [Rhodococcus rhodochrous]